MNIKVIKNNKQLLTFHTIGSTDIIGWEKDKVLSFLDRNIEKLRGKLLCFDDGLKQQKIVLDYVKQFPDITTIIFPSFGLLDTKKSKSKYYVHNKHAHNVFHETGGLTQLSSNPFFSRAELWELPTTIGLHSYYHLNYSELDGRVGSIKQSFVYKELSSEMKKLPDSLLLYKLIKQDVKLLVEESKEFILHNLKKGELHYCFPYNINTDLYIEVLKRHIISFPYFQDIDEVTLHVYGNERIDIENVLDFNI